MRYANVTMTAECGAELVVEVPAGSMDPPTDMGRKAMESVQDPTNWKLPTRELRCWNLEAAQEVAYAMDWYLGGHELRVETDADGRPDYVVSSRGYYHYVGA
jgi:hypothetical protein